MTPPTPLESKNRSFSSDPVIDPEYSSIHGEAKQAELHLPEPVTQRGGKEVVVVGGGIRAPAPATPRSPSHVSEMKCVSATIQFQSGCCRATTLHRNLPQSPDGEI